MEMSAVMWLIKKYKTKVNTRNPISMQAVLQSLWVHLLCLNPSHMDGIFWFLPKGCAHLSKYILCTVSVLF